jgi:hypothetical protein
MLDADFLSVKISSDFLAHPELGANWDIVIAWSEQNRYEPANKLHAEEIYSAIADKKHGILPWIMVRW